MGRHSSPERSYFLRSLGAWALPWLLIVAVVVIALMVVAQMVGDDPIQAADGDGSVVTAPDDETDDDVALEETETKPKSSDKEKSDGSGDAPAADKPEDKKSDDDKKKDRQPKLITKGVEIQVLNGTGASEVDDLMADKLARLGYSVVAVSPSSQGYEKTVVFWTEGSENVGSALAERFGWQLEPAPANLSSEVHLHVMVGEDRL